MSAFSPADQRALTSLRRRWLLTALLFLGITLAAARRLGAGWPVEQTASWLGLAVLVLAYELWLLWRNLHRHRSPQTSALLPTFGAGNALTLFRGLCNGLLAGFLLTLWPDGLLAWLPALLYTVSGIADYFDGYFARKSGQATPLGQVLDLEFDGLGVLIVVALAIRFGQWPLWFILVGLARYAFILGIAWRTRRRLPVYDLPPSNIRRPLAGLQMGVLTVVLWPVATPAIMTLAGLFFIVPFLASFLRDWLVVSGVLDPDSAPYRRAGQTIMTVFVSWLPLLIRLLATVAVAAVLLDTVTHFEQISAALDQFGFPLPDFVTGLFAAVELISLPFLALGAAGRTFALLLTGPIGVTSVAAGFAPERTAALAGILYTLVFGSGVYSLWKPEERVFARRIGERGGGETANGREGEAARGRHEA